jgi:hypothetical protein
MKRHATIFVAAASLLVAGCTGGAGGGGATERPQASPDASTHATAGGPRRRAGATFVRGTEICLPKALDGKSKAGPFHLSAGRHTVTRLETESYVVDGRVTVPFDELEQSAEQFNIIDGCP